jgi:rare lipoprotein A
VNAPNTSPAPQSPAPQSPTASSKDLEGLATYYAEPYHGRKTASGEIFDSYKDLTAAHRTLPFNTMVRVTNKTNGRQVDVRINDRGPFVDGRVIDLSFRAAREIDLIRTGVAPVTLTILNPGAITRSQPFAVQVGAFENQSRAEELKKSLEKKYPSVRVQVASVPTTVYRVRITEPDMETANKIASELRKRDLQTFVVRLNGEE